MLPVRTPRRFANLAAVPDGVEAVQLGQTLYPKERVDRLYEKLTTAPILGSRNDATFHSGDRVQAVINRTAAPGSPSASSISFQTHYPETGWNFSSPEEMGIVSTSPRPMREMAQMARGFENLLGSNQGRGLYVNTPISPHRAKAYEKMGFQQVSSGSSDHAQFLDNRRFKNSPAVAEMYLQKDMSEFPDLAEATARALLEKHLNLKPIYEPQAQSLHIGYVAPTTRFVEEVIPGYVIPDDVPF